MLTRLAWCAVAVLAACGKPAPPEIVDDPKGPEPSIPPPPPVAEFVGRVLTASGQSPLYLRVYLLRVSNDTTCAAPRIQWSADSAWGGSGLVRDTLGAYGGDTFRPGCIGMFGQRDGSYVEIGDTVVGVGVPANPLHWPEHRLNGTLPAGDGLWEVWAHHPDAPMRRRFE